MIQNTWITVLSTILTYWICLNVLLCDEAIGKRQDEKKGGSRDQVKYASNESLLVTDLLERYQTYRTLARPVLNSSATINVSFGISLVQILEFNAKDQMLTTLIWKEYSWRDEILKYDSEAYGGIDIIRLPGDAVWTPDIILYNNVGSPDVEQHKDLLLISPSGDINWIPPVIYHSSCSVDMTDYPFDVQTCSLRFGSWTYDVKRLDPVFLSEREAVNVQGYVPSSEWEIVDNTAKKNIIYYPCCENPYADLTFSLTLKRRVTFHMRLIIIPTVLLSCMSITIFWIPHNRPDRTGLGLSLFTSFFLLLILLVNSSPPTPSAKLGQYCCAVILMVSLGLILSVFNINIAQTKRPMPKYIDVVFVRFLGSIMCPKFRRSKLERSNCRKESENGSNSGITLNPDGSPRTAIFRRSLKMEKMTAAEKWNLVAIVLDRIFFTGFFIALILNFIFIFPKPMKLFEL